MIESLIVENYRSFSRFEMTGIGRINLLVGKNNSGKTSLLEAIQVVASGADPQVLWAHAYRRGESFIEEPDQTYRRSAEIDISHWFHGFSFKLGASLKIVSIDSDNSQRCELMIIEAPTESQRSLFTGRSPFVTTTTSTSTTTTPEPDAWSAATKVGEVELLPTPLLGLQILTTESNRPRLQTLTGRGGLLVDTLRTRRLNKSADDSELNIVFIPTEGLTTSILVGMVDDLTLTDDEGLALQAMQILDSRIQRFAAKGRERRPRIMVRLESANRPLPIGSLGDGVNRLLTIAVALAKAAGGILLIDEIDTGLHFTAMDRMWHFVSQAAQQLNVQVFATTHSRDCYESLAVICQANQVSMSQVSIQRIEVGRGSSISYSEGEIVALAKRGLEVR